MRAGSLAAFASLILKTFAGLSLMAFAGPILPAGAAAAGNGFRPPSRSHLDHAPFFSAPFAFPQDVTRACLECHAEAGSEILGTAHWLWLGREVAIPGRAAPVRVGKRNLINNFCISIAGNEVSCTQCHAGYGWADEGFDFSNTGNIDCLVCHERTGAYVKGRYGVPVAGTDLLAAAQSVSFPRRENCTVCHSYGGGGQGVKHGDLDSSLENPSEWDDVHMGRHGFLCIDCHRTERHEIAGRAFSVSVEHANGLNCTDCHGGDRRSGREPGGTAPQGPHDDPRIDAHLSALACQTCHIPTYARKLPTKTYWDWSQAGDSTRAEDEHTYLRIKGEFIYDQDVRPEYHWFDLTMDRYLLGDPIDPSRETDINRPRGSGADPAARIWPFKVHRALQPYDAGNRTLAAPVTGGEGGYWHTFDWDAALRLGAQVTRQPYSGRHGFAPTRMFWPLSHMVTPGEQALQCADCHGEHGRMDWEALGYRADPIEAGGRR
jgi:octaheme c-type cytochrome (tetrathionate reductase family)